MDKQAAIVASTVETNKDRVALMIAAAVCEAIDAAGVRALVRGAAKV